MSILNKFFGRNDSLVRVRDNLSFFDIPEPTKSLLFITNEPLSKIECTNELKIVITLGGDVRKEKNKDFFAEPSLIWTRLPIKENNNLEKEKMYYPTYADLSPECRFQYLRWLRDISQETNLSYVFLYYYGLERHLLIGNYDLAVKEMSKLIKHHNKGTFKSYAATALLASGIYKKRPDILDREPFVLDQLTNLGLFLRLQLSKNLTTEEIIRLATRVGFINRNYIRKKPMFFRKILQEQINKDEIKNGSILERINLCSLKKSEENYFANLSIPERIRTIETPQIIEDEFFKKIVFDLLLSAHNEVKNNFRK